MKKKFMVTAMLFSLLIATIVIFVISEEKVWANGSWENGDEMDDWPISLSCDPEWPLFGPEVGEIKEEVIQGLQEGNKIVSFSVKNYSKKVVKIVKKKKNTKYGAYFKVKGLKKGKAHLKVTVKLKYAQDGKKKYVWDIKDYPVGYND